MKNNLVKEVSSISETDALVDHGGESEMTMKSNAEVPSQEPKLLYDLEKGLAESRRTTPTLLTQVEMQERGLQVMAKLGLKCVKPAYPVPQNGDCLWSCFAVSRNPYLSEELLKPEAFHFRLRGVGKALESISMMGEEQLAMVQSVIAKKDREPQTREEIIEELRKYMQSGMWSGDMGDIMPSVAASGLSQGLIIIHPTERPYCTYAAPDCEMFRGKEDTPFPCIAVQQGNHYETLHLHEDSKEKARRLYETLKVGKAVTVQAGESVDEDKDGPGQEQEQHPADQSSQAGKRLLPDDVLSQTPDSQSWQNIPTRCDSCNHLGPLANHLREASICLQEYRGYPEFQIPGNVEEFIVKTCLIIEECPAPCCAQGSHHKLPDQCLNWWKKEGWQIMKWKGVDGSSSSSVIKRKMQKFGEDYNRSQPTQEMNIGSSQDSNERLVHSSRSNDNLKEQQMADHVSKTDYDDFVNHDRNDAGRKSHLPLSFRKHHCICGHEGHLANHLRESNQCVAELRKERLLQRFQGSDELFIVKAVLTLRGCPVPMCPGGEHGQGIPVECQEWWRGVGGELMRWKSFGTHSSAETVMQKINTFLKNSRRSQAASVDKLVDSMTVSSACDGDSCPICHFQGSLAQHLWDCAPCLTVLIEKYLQNRAAIYIGRTHLAIFDLGILLSFCPNPMCSTSLAKEGAQKHARGACLEFFQTEGESLYKWDKALSSLSVAAKWKSRKSWLTVFTRQPVNSHLGSYLTTLAPTLTGVCSNCCIQGPLLGIKEHELEVVGWNETAERPLWLCCNCKNQKENHIEMVRFAEERVVDLSTAKPKELSALKAVKVENPISGTSRVVFMPENVAGEEHPQVGRDELLPLSSTVLVPKNPESLDQFKDEVFDEAKHDIDVLSNLTQFLARRPFFVKPTLTLSVFWRLKIAQIKLERLSMLKSLQKTSKGKIDSRDPNMVSVVDRNPHYAVTQKLCLTNTCSWSTGSEVKRSDESAARSSVNGQVKTRVRVTLLKQREECPDLTRIFQVAIAVHGARPEIYFAPVVMNFVYGKLKLLMKHILAPAYSNWDLQLRFHSKEWTVELSGFLYSRQFEELNEKIAQEGLMHNETIKYILSQQALMPTVCLDVKQLSEIYSLDEAQAEVRNF